METKLKPIVAKGTQEEEKSEKTHTLFPILIVYFQAVQHLRFWKSTAPAPQHVNTFVYSLSSMVEQGRVSTNAYQG